MRDTPNYYGSGRTANRIILYLGGLSRERSVYFRFVFKKKKNLQFSVRVNVLDDRVEFYDPTVRGRRLVRYDGTEREREKKKMLKSNLIVLFAAGHKCRNGFARFIIQLFFVYIICMCNNNMTYIHAE